MGKHIKLWLSAICVHAALLGYAQTEWVNPFIGTSNFGACNPGAVVPNGLMSVSPFNVMGSQLNTWDKDSRWWSTPYVAENSFFTGFTHVNLSGVGCPELGSLLTMPTTGPLQVDYHIYGSEYRNEVAHPGYYSVELLNGIRAEATATTRTSLERYTFPGGEGNILLNLGEGLTNESGATVRQVSATEIEGVKLMGTFCYNRNAVFPLYFVLRVNKAPASAGYWKKQRPMTAEAAWDADAGKYKIYANYTREMSGDDIGCWFHYEGLEPGEQVQVQMGVSFVSIANARENLEAEQQGFHFDKVCQQADKDWKQHLGRIAVEGGTEDQRTIFYTALYHALIHPNVLNDVNGEYPLMESGRNGRVEPGHTRYTVFSLWDTYRNLHQLMTLLWPEKQVDMVRSMIDQYREWGWMPKWELYGRETWTMEGDPAICVIADTWLRGLKDFGIETAYEAFLKSADTPGAQNLMRPDNDPYVQLGYIPLNYFSADFSGDNSVSHALEYYVADYALSRLAADLGHKADAARFYQRSLGYKHYWSPADKCLRPRLKDGSFLTPFNPEDGADFSNAPGFHEGSAWNYSFAVPHDVAGYAKLQGGTKAFVKNLQHVFDDNLYDPANEPDIVYPFLFSRFKGYEPHTWVAVESILEKNYKNAPDGIPGNDDTGTMSAWAVFSMLGIYPDCPGEPVFTLTRPTFPKAVVTRPDGRELTITKTSAQAKKAQVDGKNKGYRISHEALLGTRSIAWR